MNDEKNRMDEKRKRNRKDEREAARTTGAAGVGRPGTVDYESLYLTMFCRDIGRKPIAGKEERR